jgi:predicted deacetylase
LGRCLNLLSILPNIKFTLFVPTAYTRIGEPSYNLTQYPAFVDELKSLPKSNFEIAFHGHFHGILNEYNRGEFTFLNYEDALKRMQLSKQAFKECGLEVKPFFRPPGFSLSPGGFVAAQEIGIKILSLYPRSPYRDIYENKDSSFDRVIYVDSHPRRPTKNWMGPPAETLCQGSVMYHACEWDTNYFSEQRKKELLTSGADFVFLGDL